MRRSPIILLVALLLLSSACKSKLEGTPLADPAVPVGLAPAASGVRQLAAKTLTDDQVALFGRHGDGETIPFLIGETTKFSLLKACSQPLPLGERAVRAAQSTWSAMEKGTASVSQAIGYYEATPGSAVLAEVKQALACGSHESGSGPARIAGEVPLPVITGADAQYAFCDAPYAPSYNPQGPAHPGSCYLLMAKASYATTVQLTPWEMNGQEPLRDMLTKIAPMVADALGR
ncbi:hypothetical protein [Amycolatopsis sp.]|jgi:hypothetical protein|uniref:hypothetical protein n=1 Tax=Amycolatopsis sp. TaxID=37632 RepID=UPI002DF9092E|nr:hypothetical protein [Amycolatopsis sp.]